MRLHAGRSQDIVGRCGSPVRFKTCEVRELLATSTVRDLTAGAQLAFDDRGMHELKGVPDARRLYAVR
jgi:hypothetical protein